MRFRKRAFCIWICLICFIRVNSQVIHEAPPVDVALTRPILPWLARYFVGAGKPNLLLDTPQSVPSINTTPKSFTQLYNVPKSAPKRVEPEEAGEAKPQEEEETKPEETPAPTEPVETTTEAPKEEEKKPEETASESPAEASTEAPKEEGTEATKDVKVPAQPFVMPLGIPAPIQPNYYYDGLFKQIQGLPAAPPVQAPFYNMPFVYYPAPYPAPLPTRPALSVPTAFPPMPSPKPVALESVELPKGWPPMPEPIPITAIPLPTVTTVQPMIPMMPRPIPVVGIPTFPQLPMCSIPAHSVVPFHSVVSHFNPACVPPAFSMPSSSMVSPKFFYRDVGMMNQVPRRHQVYLQSMPNYKLNSPFK